MLLVQVITRRLEQPHLVRLLLGAEDVCSCLPPYQGCLSFQTCTASPSDALTEDRSLINSHVSYIPIVLFCTACTQIQGTPSEGESTMDAGSLLDSS